MKPSNTGYGKEFGRGLCLSLNDDLFIDDGCLTAFVWLWERS